MNRNAELLAKRVEKAGIRASIKEGHVLTESELRNIKVQILPNPLRVFFCVLGVISAGASYYCFTNDLVGYCITSAFISILTLLFGFFGVRRTLSRILDSMDAVDAGELVGHAIEGISSTIGSLFDGI
jgi:hypothetical protein